MALRTFRIRADRRHYAVLARRYETERAGLPVLAPYPTLDALIATLSGEARADFVTRSRIVAALVARIQAGASAPLWSAVVLDAFRGMLGRLVRELKGVDRDEAPSLVGMSFAETLRRVRPERNPDCFALSVRQETRRILFRKLRRERSDAFPRPARDEDSWFDPPPHVDVEDMPDERLLPSVTLAAPSEASGSSSPVRDEHLLAASGVRGGLRVLADHLCPDADAGERETVYRQLRDRLHALRAIGRARADESAKAGED